MPLNAPVTLEPPQTAADIATEKKAQAEDEKKRVSVVKAWNSDMMKKSLDKAFLRDATYRANEDELLRKIAKGEDVGQEQVTQLYGYIQNLDDSVVKAAELALFKKAAATVYDNFKLEANRWFPGQPIRAMTEKASKALIDLRRKIMERIRDYSKSYHAGFEANYGIPGAVPQPFVDPTSGGNASSTSALDPLDGLI